VHDRSVKGGHRQNELEKREGKEKTHAITGQECPQGEGGGGSLSVRYVGVCHGTEARQLSLR
jgi:hypothetical protein